jgi:hypothetical protein
MLTALTRTCVFTFVIFFSELAFSAVSLFSFVTTDTKGNHYLLDTEGMTRKGYLVYVWQLQNLAQRNEQGALSIRTQVEFDCRFRRSRVMWVTLYPEADEGGAVISSGLVSNPQWVPAQTGDVAETLIDYACRRIMR